MTNAEDGAFDRWRDEVFGRVDSTIPTAELSPGDVFRRPGDGEDLVCRGTEWGHVQVEPGPFEEFGRSAVPEVEYRGRATRVPDKPRRPIELS